jgi:hypothetical protein
VERGERCGHVRLVVLRQPALVGIALDHIRGESAFGRVDRGLR